MIAQRSPAPIVEEEKPTPAPKQSAKPKPITKPKVLSEDSESPIKREPKLKSRGGKDNSSPAVGRKTGPYAGTWTGTFDLGLLGYWEVRITINDAQTTMMVLQSNKATANPAIARATTSADGITATFPAFKNPTGGWGQQFWTLKPDPGGKTAHVRYKDPLQDVTRLFKRED